MASDPLFDEISATTLQEVYPRQLVDQFFRATPWLAYLREKCLYPFGGGAFMQNMHLFAPMTNGAYAASGNWNTNKHQTITATVFNPKLYVAVIPEYQSELEVTQGNELTIVNLLEADTRNGINSLCVRTAIDSSNHGQSSSSQIVGNRPLSMNGWIEAVNDGITPGYEGSVFTSYGQQLRNGFIGSALNSIPNWAGDALGNPQPVQYDGLEQGYQSVSFGDQQPDLGVCNKALYAAIKMRIQPMQRLAQERDPYWGVSGMRMNEAMILKDDYFPSKKYGVNDPRIGNYLTGTFVVPAGASASSNLPGSGTTVTVGEVFCWFNMATWLFRLSNSRLYGYGLSPFVPSADNEKVVATIRAAQNLQGLAPRMNWQSYGYAAN